MSLTEKHEIFAHNHFELFKHDGPLVISYGFLDVGEGETSVVLCRPNSYSGHRLSSIVNYKEVDDKVVEYIKSLSDVWGIDDLRVHNYEVEDWKVY
jgi:hypothetical protein